MNVSMKSYGHIRTTPKKATGKTPSALTYGVEVVLSTEVYISTSRNFVTIKNNKEMLRYNIYTIEEKQELPITKRSSNITPRNSKSANLS